MHKALHILRGEHRSIGAVLHALQSLAKAAADPAVRPEFEVFRAMIYYIDAFPERMHHPKEDQHLFTRLAARSPQAQALIDSLKAEHVRGARMVRELEEALLRFEADWPKGGEAFLAAVEAYASFNWEHIRKEEDLILPLAEKSLTAEDWKAIEDAFAGNRDPIADLREQDFEKLLARIVALAPAPVGVGERWKPAAS